MDDVDNINGDFYWNTMHELETESLADGSRFMSARAVVNGSILATGMVDGQISIRTNADGSHQISGHIWEDTPDFHFATNWAQWGDRRSFSYSANGYWHKIPNVPVPASLPLLLGGVTALAALRRRKRQPITVADSPT